MLELNENRYLGNLEAPGLLSREDESELAKRLELGQLELLEVFATFDGFQDDFAENDPVFLDILKKARRCCSRKGGLSQMRPQEEKLLMKLKESKVKPRLVAPRLLQSQVFADLDPRIQAEMRQRIAVASRKIETAYRGFVESNLKLVISIARKYQGKGMPVLDLIQEGNLGLLKAVGKFDYRKGYKFSTYATWWIRQTITRFLGNKARFVRVPLQVLDVRKKVQLVRRSLMQKTGTAPTPEAIAETADIPLDYVNGALGLCADPISLSAPIRQGENGCVGDLLPDDKTVSPQEFVINSQLNTRMHRVLSTLQPREERMMRMRFGIGEPSELSREKIGHCFGVTRERVRQIEMKALGKMREILVQENAWVPFD